MTREVRLFPLVSGNPSLRHLPTFGVECSSFVACHSSRCLTTRHGVLSRVVRPHAGTAALNACHSSLVTRRFCRGVA